MKDMGLTLKGYVFTFDSFIAFILVITSIYVLFSIIQTEDTKILQLTQNYLLANDIVNAMKHWQCDGYNCTTKVFMNGLTSQTNTLTTYVGRVLPEKYHIAVIYRNSTHEEELLIPKENHYNNTKEYMIMATAFQNQDTVTYAEKIEPNTRALMCTEPKRLNQDTGKLNYAPNHIIFVKVYV